MRDTSTTSFSPVCLIKPVTSCPAAFINWTCSPSLNSENFLYPSGVNIFISPVKQGLNISNQELAKANPISDKPSFIDTIFLNCSLVVKLLNSKTELFVLPLCGFSVLQLPILALIISSS